MGYYANWSGSIKFKEEPAEEIVRKVNDCFYVCDNMNKTLYVADNTKYYEDEAIELLEEINPLTENGEIVFSGEDDSHWRFIFKDGEWIEESGAVYYELPEAKQDKEEFLGCIIDVMQDCLDKPKGDTIKGEWYDEVKEKLTSIMIEYRVFQ